jgi:hypothetical protein
MLSMRFDTFRARRARFLEGKDIHHIGLEKLVTKTRKTKMKKVGSSIPLSLLLAAFVFLPSCNFFYKKGEKYYLPDKYSGWVCVNFNVSGAPPLSEEDGYLVAIIPHNGILETSSRLRSGANIKRFYYYTEKGSREAYELRHGGGGPIQKGEVLVYNFWVSSGDADSDYKKYVKGKDPLKVECGPWENN